MIASVRQSELQAAELAWWQSFLQSKNALIRMYALYGARYLEFFYEETTDGGDTVEFGPGPLPAAGIFRMRSLRMVEPLDYGDLAHLKDLTVPSADELPDESFDTALVLNVLDHTDEPAQIIRDAYRVLRPGGRMLVFVHLEARGPQHVQVSAEECLRWVEDAGFYVERRWDRRQTIYDPPALYLIGRK